MAVMIKNFFRENHSEDFHLPGHQAQMNLVTATTLEHCGHLSHHYLSLYKQTTNFV